MSEDRIQNLEAKIAFLERHIEQSDKAFVELNKDVAALMETVRALVAQRKNNSPGGIESSEDAIPPHY